jgi:hypothetical protein
VVICGDVVIFANGSSLLEKTRLIDPCRPVEPYECVIATLHAMVILERYKSDELRTEAAPAESGSALVPILHHVCMFGASRLNCFNIESAYSHLLDLSS